MINDTSLIDANARWHAWRETSLIGAELDAYGHRVAAPLNPNRIVAAVEMKIDPDTKMSVPVKLKDVAKKQLKSERKPPPKDPVEMTSSWFKPQPTELMKRSLAAYRVDWHPSRGSTSTKPEADEHGQLNQKPTCFQRKIGKAKGQDLERSIAREKELLIKLSQTRLASRK